MKKRILKLTLLEGDNYVQKVEVQEINKVHQTNIDKYT